MTDRILLVTGTAGMDRELMRALREKESTGELLVVKAPDPRPLPADLCVLLSHEPFNPKHGPDPRDDRRRLEGKRRHR